MLGSPTLYLKGMRILMFQLSGFYYRIMGIGSGASGWIIASRFRNQHGSFRKFGVPDFGVLIIRILLFRLLY